MKIKSVSSFQVSHSFGLALTSYFHSQYNHKIVGFAYITKSAFCLGLRILATLTIQYRRPQSF